ncbi:alpha/beta hydrolase [Rhizobium sp. BR 317]|uniref:Acetyl esterase/lipase n=2 Tax=Rhizobium/Agrobacterium group TaxID=227290 RepID=A0A7W8XUV9_9HYPH|nr:alpha/beta hydrolase [Rhizobium paranaense]MBB5576022.1 acetyl esterase/lipase [Rhizobium paranaense]
MNGFWFFRFMRLFATASVATVALAVSPALPVSTAYALDAASQTKASNNQIDKLIEALRPTYAAQDLRQRRAAFERLMASTPDPTRVQIRHVDANGVDADLIWPARLHHPIGRRVILYLHGGGFYSGSLRTHRNIAGSLAKAASADVLLVDYRLLPENRVPAQIDDTLAAYRWLLASGYRPENVVIVGESVGGTLAIEATLNQLRIKGPLPAAVVAMSPVTDFAATGESITTNADNDPFMGKAELEVIRNIYIGDKSPVEPARSPLYADLTGFPPLLLQVGSRETLLDDTRRLEDKARKAGVDVTAEVWPGMIHQWQIFPFWIEDARKSNRKVAEFAVSHFADRPEE